MSDTSAFREALSSPIPSLSTPFLADGAIDYTALRAMVDFDVANDARAVMLTVGDSLYTVLTDDEVAEVTRVVIEQTAGRAMTIASDRSWATGKVVKFARFVRGLGGDMLMVLCPDWALSCTLDTLVEHYAAIAAEMPVMLVTNWLAPRPASFSLAFLKRIADEVPGVVAIKDDLCDTFARQMSVAVHDRIAIVSGGQKQNHLNNLPYGCDGYLSTFARFHPPIAHAYWQAIQADDLQEATRIIREYDMPLFDYLIPLQGGFDAGIHGLLEIAGLAQRWRRKPYYSLNDEEMDRLRAFVQDKGIRL